MRAIIYDCEIVKGIPGKSPDWKPAPGIEYCEGWHDHANMGISCICAYDPGEMRAYVFLKDNLDAFSRLAASASVLIGFNNIAFDDRLLAANGVEMPDPEEVPRFDILAETWENLGMGRQYGGADYNGYGLDPMAKANLGNWKTGDGAFAPVLWQMGLIGTVIDYCQHDVSLTARLANMIEKTGHLNNPLPEPSRRAANQPPDIAYKFSPKSMANGGITRETYLNIMNNAVYNRPMAFPAFR